MNEAIRDVLILSAADLWTGEDPSVVAASEYFRGQVELIANSTGAYKDNDDPKTVIAREILSLLSV
jgi:hypothetical protein